MHAPKGVSEYRRLAKDEMQHPPSLSKNDTLYFCGGGLNSFAINAYGEMGICVISQQETFDIRREGLQPTWEHSLKELRTRKRTRVTKCIQCRILRTAKWKMATARVQSIFFAMWHISAQP
jgi:hypothetical protein